MDRLQGFVDRADLGEAISIVLSKPEYHHRAIYEIVGVNNTHTEVARFIGHQLGNPVKADNVGLQKFIQIGKEAGNPMLQDSHPYSLEGFKYVLFVCESSI